MPIEIFMDCGAPTLYNKLSRKEKGAVTRMGSHLRQRKMDDFSYVDTDDYRMYRREYADFIKSHPGLFSVYSNLDVINNAELTYKNQKWMEKHGLKPAPVWHFGTDIKWLERYLAEGYGYICVGGMVPNPPPVLRPALDRIWQDVLTDKDGMPKIKVHGFAMTSFSLMYRYPWYSVDSKSWIDMARYGKILVPILKNGKRNWLHPRNYFVTERSFVKAKQQTHLRAQPAPTVQYVKDYLKEFDTPFGKSAFKDVEGDYSLKENELWVDKPVDGEPGRVEVVVEPGVCNQYYLRMDVNLRLFCEIEKAVPTWPWSVRQSIRGGKKGVFDL